MMRNGAMVNCGGVVKRSSVIACLRETAFGIAGLVAGVVLTLLAGCSGMPSLAVQAQHIRNNELTLRQLEPHAFVRAWGEPTYQRTEFMPFFGMKDGSLVPRSRLAIGESPKGWEIGFDAGDALFLAYPDQGWLIVFLDETFVYREALSADQLHEIGRGWEREDRFRTTLERPSAP